MTRGWPQITLQGQLTENRIIIACAGSGKTRRLVSEALQARDRRIAFVTYTNNNASEIRKRFGDMNCGVPEHTDVMTWFGFLLRECARPYQIAKYDSRRIDSLMFVTRHSARYSKEADTKHHYFANDELIYSDKIAKFVVKCNAESRQSIIRRLRRIYTDVFVDEFQDLAGWDLEFIAALLDSGMRVTLVGDPRQHIYSTHPSAKNRQYVGITVVKLVKQWEKDGLCSVESMSASHRCGADICSFANTLWPGMDGMRSVRRDGTGHDGVFLVGETMVEKYMRRFRPQILRHDRRARTYGYDALNFGSAKGLEFSRVLIVPTDPIRRYLQSGHVAHIERGRDRLHVAVTRAFHSVAFVYDGESAVVTKRWDATS